MASLMQELQRNGSVPLEAYGHQVGGHHLLVKFKEDAVCKPLITREHLFYETITPDLRAFTPGYHGTITITLERKPSGEIKIVAYPRQNGPSVVDHSSLSCSTHKSIHKGEDAITSKAEDGATYVSPWSAQCKKITRDKLLTKGDETHTINEDYVVLENLTSKFSAPSILDLKIGTRQHGDDVPEAKVKKHKETCANSTSRTLGVRICGSQRYDASRNEYVFRDKYYGRYLSEDGFHEELRTFLHNGVRFRSDLVPHIIHMLEELQRVIERQDSFRFYSSSLLIIYDGAECASVMNGVGGAQSVDTRTNGITTPPLVNHTHSPNRENGPLNSTSLEALRKHVDIRMIDFGHTTHAGIGDTITYCGPDTGYLLGLSSLIASFRQMLV